MSLPKELEPVSNHILFQFADETNKSDKGSFKRVTDWGFEMGATIDDTTKTPRWVEILGIGPDVSDEFHVGQIVLVDALKWTPQVEYEGVQFARTDDSNILAIDEDT